MNRLTSSLFVALLSAAAAAQDQATTLLACALLGLVGQRMLEAISAQWHLLGAQARFTSNAVGTTVVVEYTLNRMGEITRLDVLFTNSSSPGTLIVTDAIKSRSPFGPWTKEMIAVLGQEQDIRITFYYR